MNKEIKFKVFLSHQFCEYFDSEFIISSIGLVQCFTVTQSPYYLELDVLYDHPDGPGIVHLSIPHSYVLCILSSPDMKLDKIHGFRVASKKPDIRKD